MVRSMRRFLGDAYRYLRFEFSQFRGIYDNFPQAEAAVPWRGKIGYNHEDLAREYQANISLHLDSLDYPILFHLDRIIRGFGTVLDFGGNIGTHYLRYQRYLDFEKVKWIVCDLPAITRIGRKTCSGMSNVVFINDIDELVEPQIDVLLASGSLQYVAGADPILRTLTEKGIRPVHILINCLPLYDGEQFVTLQNGGLVYYPQYVFNRDDYIKGVANWGYELIDCWDDKLDKCIIPFHPERSVHVYSGLYFAEIGASPSVLEQTKMR